MLHILLLNAMIHTSTAYQKENKGRDRRKWTGVRPGHSGNPKISGRVIRVLEISGFRNYYPKFV